MASFELSALRSLGVTRRNPPTLASEAAKLSGHVLPNRKPPAPPGAAQSLENGDAVSSPTKNFILDTIEERLGEPSTQRKINEQVLDAGAGLLRKRNSELTNLANRLPSIDVEELSRQRIERAAEESRRAKEQQEALAPEAPEVLEKRTAEPEEGSPGSSPAAEASKTYKKLLELAPKADRPDESRPSATVLETREREAPSARRDIASGGASDADKGDPGVNVVA